MKQLTQNNVLKFGFVIRFGLISALAILSLSLANAGQTQNRDKTIKPLLTIRDANRPSLSFDGSRISVMPEIGLTEVYDVDLRKKIGSYKLQNSCSEIISSDGNQVVIFHSDITGYEPDNHYSSKNLYSIYDIKSGKLIKRGEPIIFKNGKETGSLAVSNQSENYKSNISSDLDSVVNTYFYDFENPDSQAAVLKLGRLSDNSLINEFRTEDSFLEFDFWRSAAMTSNGNFVAAGRYNSRNAKRERVMVWDAKTGKIVFNISNTESFSLSDNGERIAVKKNSDAGEIEFWNIKTGKLISTLSPKVEEGLVKIGRYNLSPDGKLLVTTGRENFYIWDVETGRILGWQRNEGNGSTAFIDFSGNGKRVAIDTGGGEVVTVWSVEEILKNTGKSNF